MYLKIKFCDFSQILIWFTFNSDSSKSFLFLLAKKRKAIPSVQGFHAEQPSNAFNGLIYLVSSKIKHTI